MNRIIREVLMADNAIDDGDMHLRRALPHAGRTSLGPFVFLDHYRHVSRRGIGDSPHPHAGIEVVSYLLDGSVEHRDSAGFSDRLEAGDGQFIRAGRGILHAEQPQGGRHGLQLWISLPPELKLVDPSYTAIRKKDIPVVRAEDATLFVVAGAVNGTEGPMQLSGGAIFARLQLTPAAAFTLEVPSGPELGLYVLQGRAQVEGNMLTPGSLALLQDEGSQITICAQGEDTLELALIGGNPVKGEVLFSGPFVMDTPERLAQARRDFVSGKMGRLDGVPF